MWHHEPCESPAYVLLRLDGEEAKKKARLEKLAAWKRQQEQQQQQHQPVFDAPADDEEDAPVITRNDAKVW
jgi:DNA gyrase inhibitor GyrI